MRTLEDGISIGDASFEQASPEAALFVVVTNIGVDRYARRERVSPEDQSSTDAEFVTEGDARVGKADSSC
jgi:hypothetical protein